MELSPDLVIDVLSPGDRPGEVLAKVADTCQVCVAAGLTGSRERYLLSMKARR
jgi:hypothetical protein